MTGYHGDKVWEKDTPYTGVTIVRGDPLAAASWSSVSTPVFFTARSRSGVAAT